MVGTMQGEQVAVVPAAGLGTRLGLGPKAFLTLDGVSLLDRVATQPPFSQRVPLFKR